MNRQNTIHELGIENFTLFSEFTRLTLSPQLNIFIGENSTGKTHLLKLAYSILAATVKAGQKVEGKLEDNRLAQAIADKLIHVFRAEQLNHLVRDPQKECQIGANFSHFHHDMSFHIAPHGENLEISHAPDAKLTVKPIFLPTHDLLMIYPNFVSVYENYYLEFEETWRDTCMALGGLKQKNLPVATQALLTQIEAAMGGKIELDKNGRFYLNLPNKRLEVPLIAEGQRKLATLAQLLMTGALQHGYLFWDEPEANLNPRLIKKIAPILLSLCELGVQVFIATHSLFLLREIEICLAREPYQHLKTRWFGLYKQDDSVVVEQGNSVDDIGDIAALDEELEQSDRFMNSGI